MSSKDDYNSDNNDDNSNQFNIDVYFSELYDFIESLIEDTSLEQNKKNASLNDKLSNLILPFINKKTKNELFLLLEKLRKKDKLIPFLDLIQRIKIKNRKVLTLFKDSFLSQLNVLAPNKTEKASLLMFKYIIANFIYTIDIKSLQKLRHFLSEKIAINKTYLTEIIAMIEKNTNIYTILICGIALSVVDSQEQEIKSKLSDIFTKFICDKVLDDKDKDKNLVLSAIFAQFVPFVTENDFNNSIIQRLQQLLNRSSQNGVFLYHIFRSINNLFKNSSKHFEYNNEFVSTLFNKFESFFFPNDDSSCLNYCFESFSYIIKCVKDKKELFNQLLKKEFDSGKSYKYNYSISYLIDILNEKNSKHYNKLFTKNELALAGGYILSKFDEPYSQADKEKYYTFFINFIESLITNETINDDNFSNESIEQLYDGINEFLSKSKNYHCYVYLIFSIFLYKFKCNELETKNNLTKEICTYLSNSQQHEINEESLRNILPLLSLCYSHNSIRSTKSEMITNILTKITDSEIIPKIYKELSTINAISIYIICLHNLNNTNYLNNLSYVLFSPKTSTAELTCYNTLLSNILKSKEISFALLDLVFMFILNNNSSHDISYERVSKFISEFTSSYVNSFTPKEFVKVLILAHIPNMNHNMNINNKRPHHKNTFLISFYAKHKEAIVSNLENSIDVLSSFICSEIGLFNKQNKIIVSSCYEIIKYIFEETKVSHNFLCKSFGKLDVKKFDYIDRIIKFYNREVDLIGFYYLDPLVEELKQNEVKFKQTYQYTKEKIEDISNKMKTTSSVAPKGKDNKKKIQQTNDNKNKNKSSKNQDNENSKQSKSKDEKEQECKRYLTSYCYNLSNNLMFLLKRLHPIIEHLLKTNCYNIKENIKYVIEKLWTLLECSFCNEYITQVLQLYFKSNPLTNQFKYEFPHLMYLETTSSKPNTNAIFELINEKNPSLITKFNSKLNEILTAYNDSPENKAYIDKLFNHFDFVIIRILFYIVLNKNITIDDTVLGVDNLILILKYSTSLNYNDITPLLVSVLKSNYTGDNLLKLLELYFANASEDNFHYLCKGLLEYEYISKYSFLKAVLTLNMRHMRKYQDIHYKIFIIIFEENEHLSELAISIWNKYDMIINEDFINSNEFAIAMKDHPVSDSAIRAICAFVQIMPNMYDKVLQILKSFYEKEVVEAKQLYDEAMEEDNKEEEEEEEEEKEEEGDKAVRKDHAIDSFVNKRQILLTFIDKNLDLFNSDEKRALLDFLMKVSNNEFKPEIFEQTNHTIFNIIHSIQDKDIIDSILNSITSNITSILERNNNDMNYANLKIILMMCYSILVRTLHEEKYKSTKQTLFQTLLQMARKITNKEILYLLFQNFEYICSDIGDHAQKEFKAILDKLTTTNKTLINFGDVYALSGMIKCFGIASYKANKINELILNNMKKESPIENKQNAMYMISIFFETMKKLYEPFFVDMFDNICLMIADRESKVRETAQICFKGMMKELSGHGVNEIMPRLIKDLHQMNWKSKVANIEILGQFAFCAPKQLTIYIPKVIKEIMQVLKDPHTKVQETAVSVLNDIASAIQNPEIVDISSILIDAISNPYENSTNALNALLETEFRHYLDSPSLALIIPIIDYNLKSQNNVLKRQASHVIGSLQHIISNNNDLIQYSDIIIPNLKSALFDSNPDCRNAIAKAIGALTQSLGPSYLENMLNYIIKFLENPSDTVQRSGAAQAYAEIIISFGENYLDKALTRLISKIQEGNHIVKEGYLSIFVFLPGCLGDRFEKYFELIFPLIIEAFSDDNENVRNVSNKIFEICIKLYAKKNTNELIEPLLKRLFDPNWRIRNSSIALIKTLIMNLNNEFFKESSTYFPKEQRDKILTKTFVLKSDFSGNTSTIANMIWRDYVDNIPKYLSKILRNIYHELMHLLSYQIDETFDIAENSAKLLASKFSDKFFMELLPIIKETILKENDKENIVNTSFYILLTAVSEISEKLLSMFKDKILRIINEHLFTQFTSVRKQIAKIVYEISKKLNDHNLNRNLIFNVMKQARGKECDEQKKILEIVAYLIEISKGEIINYAISEIFRKPYEEGFLVLGSMISEPISVYYSDAVDIKNLYNNLYEAFLKFPASTVNTIVSITEKYEDDALPLFIEFLSKLQTKLEQIVEIDHKKISQSKTSLDFYFSEILSNFCLLTQQNITPIMNELVEITTHLFYFNNSNVTRNIGGILKALVDKTEKSSSVDTIIESFLASLTSLNNKFLRDIKPDYLPQLISMKFQLIMDSLLSIIQNGLLYGGNKELACNLVSEVIQHSTRQNLKPSIMKIVGPIIRILSEKITPEIKEKLMDNAKALIAKSKEDIKGISPQLQSVFLKILTDSSVTTCERFQIKAGENIIRLLQYYPRADVTANDLLKSIQNKIDIQLGNNAMFEMEILSDVIRFYGQALKQNTITQQFNTVKIWLDAHPEIPFDVIIVLLSSYTQFLSDEVKSNVKLGSDLHEKLYSFISAFNGDLKMLGDTKSIVEKIKSLKKDQAIILLKPLGKIINKYRCYKEFNTTKTEEILQKYEEVVKDILNKSDLLVASSELPDANLCLFLVSLGYMKVYDTDKSLLKKVFGFIVELMDAGKINLQLLVSCLSLLVLKEIKQSPNRDEVMEEIGNITDDEKQIGIVDTFLKKIYYLFDR